MMAGGSLDVDYAVMREGAARLTEHFADADSVHITTEAGTDLILGLSGRRMVNDVHITETELGANLPCGEVFCCPEETLADGALVIDGCFGTEGNVSVPATITCRGGQVVDVTSDDPVLTARINALMDTDDGSRTIAELGIGLNPGAGLRGNMLEDEKALRTAHIAFGSNEGMPGGRSVSSMHMDYLFHRPTMTVTYADGSTRCVIRDGDVL
jgi:leucyl aminopeptidase (aminopeptidase T)